MYKYKPVRYLFRALNLVIYAAAASIVFISVLNEIYLSDVMDSIFHDYYMDTKHAIFLRLFYWQICCLFYFSG